MTRIAIIGGGVAGLSAAARLAGSADVTLFEAEEHFGYHASGRSAAMFEENYGNAAVRALNRGSRAFLEDAGVLAPRGLLMVALGGEEEAFEADLDEMNLAEIALEDARRRVPILAPDITRAAMHDSAMDIDTGRLLDVYAGMAREGGARLVRGAPVTGIERQSGVWSVHAGTEKVEVDIIVNAAGAWADQIAGLAGVHPIGLQAYRRSMARLPAPGGHKVADWPMLFGPGESWYAKPDAGGWIVSPAEEDPVEPMDAWADDMVLAEGIARYEAHVTEPVTRVETNWAGLRTFAPDRALVIGEAADAPAFYWFAGQGGYGFQTSPAASGLLADVVLGNSPALSGVAIAALASNRFGGARSGV